MGQAESGRLERRTILHIATFERMGAKASLAWVLLHLTVNLKRCAVFDGDELLEPNAWTALRVLDCCRQA